MIGDPGLIAAAQAGLDPSALVLKYQRSLLDQLDELSLDGISDIRQIRLRLNAIYVERSLIPIDPFAVQQISIDANMPGATLAELVRAPGHRSVWQLISAREKATGWPILRLR